MKGCETRVTFHQETWHQACLAFIPLVLKMATTKTYFAYYDI